MKLVTLSTKDIHGGAARVAFRLHEQLIKNGVNNLYLVNQKRTSAKGVAWVGNFHDKQSYFMLMVSKWKLKKAEQKRLSLWNKYRNRKDVVFLDLEISLLKNALNKISFDILQLHWVGESYVDFTEFQGINKPIVWTLHDCSAFTGICTYFDTCDKFTTHCASCPQLKSDEKRDLSYRVFEQKIERYANLDLHIICPSNWIAEYARKSYLLKKYPIQVIPNGIDTNFFYPIDRVSAKEALGLDKQKKYILFPGISILSDPRKGGQLLLEALTILQNTFSKDEIQLLILGTEKDKIDLGFETTFFGFVENEKMIRILYAAADLTVVPSMQENLPTTIMESMSCGRPVVAFNIGGNGDMVDHKINGYLATPFDTKDLAEGIRYCLDPSNTKNLDLNARQKVVENFRIEDVANSYVELYKSLMHK